MRELRFLAGRRRLKAEAAKGIAAPALALNPICRAGWLYWARAADRWFATLIEVTVAILVTADGVILFAGVIARYLLNVPLVWSDELASILFLWIAMLGSAVALQRSEHMRMTAVIGRYCRRELAERTSLMVTFSFLLLLVKPALHFALEEAVVTTPAMEISQLWRAAALPVGVTLMIVAAISRLLKICKLPAILMLVATILAIIALVAIVPVDFHALGSYNLLIFFVGVVGILVFAGVPIAFSFGLATFGYIALTTRIPTQVIVGRMDEGMGHIILLAVPLFVLLGRLIEITGMAQALIGFLAGLLGHVRGGLSYVLIAAMYLVSGISGSKAADMAAVAPSLFPEMKARGAKPGELVALLSATGAQTETVPPSLVLITIGSVTGISIADLFNGGLLPSAVLGLTLCVLVWFRNRNDDLSNVKRMNLIEIGKAFVIAVPGLILPFIVRTAVAEGVATATEVSTIGIVYVIIVGIVIYRRMNWNQIYPALVDTASLTGAILLIIGTASGMAWVLTQSGLSAQLALVIRNVPGGIPVFMVVSILTFVILGSILEGIPAIVLLGPLLFPIAKLVGLHEVHYAMVVVLAMGIGLFTPPFGVGYYSACAISRVHPDEGIRPILGYVLALLTGLTIVAAVPWLSTAFL
jgi:tripartite ATP-independent transporter DctM subunit